MLDGDDEQEIFVLAGPRDAAASVDHWLHVLRGWTVDCSVVEVGSTGVQGLPTKGDLDIAVVAPDAITWANGVAALEKHLIPHEPQNWSMSWASFRGDGPAGEVGVQVVVAGEEEDQYLRGFRALLLQDAGVVARYSALKARYDGGPMQSYRAAKGRFVVDELAARDRESE